jgi:hypothetical protein
MKNTKKPIKEFTKIEKICTKISQSSLEDINISTTIENIKKTANTHPSIRYQSPTNQYFSLTSTNLLYKKRKQSGFGKAKTNPQKDKDNAIHPA